MTIQQAIEVLRMNGYYVDNMWHRSDVTEKFHCTADQADEILNSVLNSESICDHIQERIFSEGDEMELELKDDYK
jgi:hypothetical protein